MSFVTYGQKITASGPLSFCMGGSVELKVEGTENGSAFQWMLKDDSIKNQTSINYNVNTTGEYYVIISNRGAGKQDTTIGPVTVTVYNYPTASFTSDVKSDQCRNTSVKFTATTSNDKSYSWDFGDPNSGSKNTSSQKNPTHVFVGERGVKTQTFTVSLTVTGDGGCAVTSTKVITITQKTDASLTGTGIKSYNGETYFTICAIGSSGEFSFVNTSTTKSSNTHYRIIWGDGSPDFDSAAFNVSKKHTYTVGVKSLLFIVTGPNGCIDTAKYKVFLGTNPAVGLGNPGNTSICTESTLTFPISETGSNSPETNYTVIINDGTNPVTFPHPAPPNFTHQFLISSCGTTSGNYPNSFSAKIIATNPCLTSEAVITPIYVSGKPKAAFKVSSSSICVNKSVIINNTSVSAQNVTTSGVCSNAKVVWKISPATGWTLQSGTLGNDNGVTDTDLWNVGSDNLNVVFTTTGKYQITLLTGNANCGTVSTTSEICVNPTPNPSFIIDNSIGCGPLDVAATSTVNAPTCGTYKYKWTVDYVAVNECTPSVSNYKYISGDDASVNPKFQFINPGVYTIGLVVSTADGGCVSQKVTKTVTIKGNPVIGIEALPSAICQFGVISPKASIKCFIDNDTKYTWTFDGGVPATSSNSNPGNIVYNTPGTYNIKLSVKNECGISNTTSLIKVDPTPVITVPANIVVCAGEIVGPINLITNPGSAISWTSSKDIGFGFMGVTNPIKFTAKNDTQNPITSTITISGKINNCSASKSFTITVNPTPPTPTGTTTVIYCKDAFATPLSANATAGNSLLWYTTPTGGIGNPSAPTPVTTSVGSKTYYVSQKNDATGCESSRLAINVTVNAIPSISSAVPTNPSACKKDDGQIKLTGLSANTLYSVSYNGKAPTSMNSNAAGEITITKLTAGAYDIIVSLNGCLSNNVSTSLSDPSAPAVPTVGSNSPVCEGSKIELTANTTTPGTITYNWQGPNNYSSISQNPTIAASTLSSAGNYQVTATQAGCTSAAGIVNVIVNPTPKVNISGTTPICSGSDIQLNYSTAFSNPFTYAWTGPNSFTSTDANPKITNAQTIASGIYKLIITATTGNCSSPEATTNVVVNPTPVISNLDKTDPTNCASSTGSITFDVTEESKTFTVNYLQSGVPKTATIVSSTDKKIKIQNLPAGVYDKIYIVSNANCSSNELGPITLSDPNPPAAPIATSNGPICSNNDLQLKANTISNATYNWSGPNGFSSKEQNPTIAGATIGASGTYSVTVTVASCSSPAGTVDVVVNQTPTVRISSNSPICSGNDLQLNSSTAFTDALTYAWTGPNSFTSVDANPRITNAQTNVSGTYKLIITATASSCPSPEATTKVVVNLTPVISNLSKTDPINCKSNTGTISFDVLTANEEFTVYYTQDGNSKNEKITSDGSKKITIKNLPSGNYKDIYVKSNSDCASQELGPIDLKDPNPPVTPVASGSPKICSGTNLTLSAQTSTPGTAFYNWSGPNNFSSNLQNPSINNAITAASGKYFVSVTINDCKSEADMFEVVVDSTPAKPTIKTNSPVCSDNDINLDFTTDFPGTLTYSWTGPKGFSSDLKNPIIPNATVSDGGSYLLKIASTEGCFSESTATVIVNQTPIITASGNNPLNCAKPDGSIVIHGLSKNTVYTIGYTKDANSPTVLNNIASDGNGDARIKGIGQGDYTKIHVILNNCPSNEVSVSLQDPGPPIIQSVSNNGPLCVGATLNLIASADPGVSYSWAGPNGFISTTQNPLKPNVTAADGGKYTLIIEKNNCSSSASTDVIVNALPPAPLVNDVEYCIGSPASPISATPSAGGTLIWYTTSTGGTGSATAPTPQTSISGTTSYFVSQTDGNSCESERAEIKVIIHPDAIAEFTPTKIIDCPPFIINTKDVGLKEYPLNNKLYQWYAEGTFIGEGITFPGYTIPSEDETITIQLKTSSLFGCKDAEVSHTFSTYKLPHPSFTISTDEGCGPLKVSFTNITPNPTFFNYYWDFGNGTTSSSATPSDVVFLPNPNADDTAYIVKLKVWNDCDTVVVEKSITVKSKPIALFTPSKTEGCSPMSITFANTTKGKNVTYTWDFGDGHTETTTSSQDASHTFNTGEPTTFTVRLTATNDCGSDFKEFKIVVSPNPIKLKFAMNGPDHFGCEPHTIVIDNNSSGASSFFWDFGDGNFLSTTKGVDQIQHTYLSSGDYTITVKASNNCTDTIAYDYVHVYPKPKAAFTADRYVVCINDELNFKNESQLATSYLWEFGDGITSTLSDPKHIYKTPGLYTVKLTVFKLNTPGSTCTETVEQKIQVNTIMPGSITMSATEANCAPFTIHFENNINPSVTAVWDFGDGSTGVGDAIQHTYQSSGIYQVTLTITVPGGCTYVTQKTVTIKGPSGTFTYNSGFICSTDAVRFEARATGTDSYFWDFGDGNNQTTTTPIVYHTYANGGIYLPTVTFKNNTGCNYFVKGLDSIKVDKIEAGFITTQEKTCGITKVNFSDTSHVLFGKKEILWNFGDGITDSGASVSHTYTASGIYTMTMTIKGNSNCQEIITKNIEVHVNNNPIVVITANTVGCNNKSILFTTNINSVDEINTIKWEISNGITGSGKSFDYLFLTPGTYIITWTVGTVNGCFSTATHTITINPSPIVKASTDVIVCLGNSTQLNVSGAPNYQWSPLEGLSCTNCANPIAKPSVSTPYLVQGINSFGCVDADTVIVTVIKPLQMTDSGNDSICIGKSANLSVSGAASYLWTPAEGLSSTTISNPIANPIITTTYRVVGYDGYNCFTDTAFIVVGVGDYPTVDLGLDQNLSTGTILPLKTIITNGPIKNWLWTPTTNLDCNNCALPNAHIKKDITYTVKVTTVYGCEASDTINIKVFCENTQVFIPNAFTPDGDGVNDILMVRATGIVTVKSFRIFNRWGELVFEKNNFPPNEFSYGWDGRVKGKMSSSEVFVYTAEVLCENGVSFIYKGNTTILK